jgi:uncharacterized membrane protein YbhN (UPF0104 family)
MTRLPDDWRQWSRRILALVLLALIGYILLRNPQALHELLASWTLAVALAAVLLLLLQNVAQFLLLPVLLRPVGHRLPMLDIFRVGSVSSLLSAIGPFQAGLAYKALYLKFSARLESPDILALLLVQKLLRTVICAAFGLAALASFDMELRDRLVAEVPARMTAWLSAVLVLFTIVVLVALLRTRSSTASKGRVHEFLRSSWRGMRLMLANPLALTTSLGLHGVNLLANAVLFYLLLAAAGYRVPALLMVGYVCVKYFANIVSVLPANLGISEFLTGGLAVLLGAELAVGVGIALQVRLINLVLLAGMSAMLAGKPATAT